MDFLLTDNKVCWTEIEPKVIRCSVIDKTKKGKVDKEVIVDTGVIQPEGLACDWANRLLYWTDSRTQRIEVVGLDLKNRTEVKHPVRDRRVLVWQDIELPRAISVSPRDGYE